MYAHECTVRVQVVEFELESGWFLRFKDQTLESLYVIELDRCDVSTLTGM